MHVQNSDILGCDVQFDPKTTKKKKKKRNGAHFRLGAFDPVDLICFERGARSEDIKRFADESHESLPTPRLRSRSKITTKMSAITDSIVLM